MSDDKKKTLIDATKGLLTESNDIENITTRVISERAGANLALINYYFGSKDELMKIAANEIIESHSKNMYGFDNDDDPKDCIFQFFKAISSDMVKYRKFTKLLIPDLLLKDEIKLPDKILPMVRKHFGKRRTESECRFAAYRLVSEAQLIFYRSDDIGRYIGADITKGYDAIIKTIIDDIMG